MQPPSTPFMTTRLSAITRSRQNVSSGETTYRLCGVIIPESHRVSRSTGSSGAEISGSRNTRSFTRIVRPTPSASWSFATAKSSTKRNILRTHSKRRAGGSNGFRRLCAILGKRQAFHRKHGRSIMKKDFDAIVIGTGQSGPFLAVRLAATGQRVAIIERHRFGGTCVNTGCVPTKTLVASAYNAHMVARAADFGIQLAGTARVNIKRVKARKDEIVEKSRNGLEAWLENTPNCTVYCGHARFESPREVSVGEDLLAAPQIFINVGGRAAIPSMPGVENTPYLTNSTLLDLDVLPRHLIIIGGGYVGLEFGQIFRRFGSDVTIIEPASRLIAHEDEDVSAEIEAILRRESIGVRLNAACIALTRRENEDVGVRLNCTEGPPEVRGSHVLLAMGRRPNTADLNLEKAGVAADPGGSVLGKNQRRADVPGIWALGDCNGRGAFTH